MRFRLEYLFLVGFSRLVCALPLDVALTLGRALGAFVGYVVRYRRKVALENLRRAFGAEKDKTELRRIARGVYRHFGQMIVEFCRFPVLDGRQIERWVTLENPDVLEQAAKGGEGAVLISGHFGNWEMMGAAIVHKGYPMRVLVANQKNAAVGDLMDRFRRCVGLAPIRVGLSVKEVLRAIERGEFVGIIADQNAGRRGIFVDFFGRPTSAPQGPAAIALKKRVPIVLGFALRERGGQHRIVLEGFPDPDRFPPGAEGVHAVTQLYTKRLEHYVRRYPEQWLWLHRRWKCSPP